MKDKIIELKKSVGKFLKNLNEIEVKMEAEDGSHLLVDGDLVVGTGVYVYDETGDIVPAPDGQYNVPGFGEIVVADGVITEVMPEQEDEGDELVEMTAEDGTILYVTEKIVGASVFTTDKGEPANDGEYNFGNEKIVVKDGLIAEIIEKTNENEDDNEQNFNAEEEIGKISKRIDDLVVIVDKMNTTFQEFASQDVDGNVEKMVKKLLKDSTSIEVNAKAAKYFTQK